MNISDAIVTYLPSVSAENKTYAQSELHKFARWVGLDRNIEELMPPEIAKYAEGVVSSGGDVRGRLTHLKLFLAFLFKRKEIVMSLSGHVKIPKESKGIIPATTDIDTEQIVLTQAGLKALNQELATLKGQRTKVAEDIRYAAADKDFRENAPLDAAREQQGKMESRIREIEALLQMAVLAESRSTTATKIAAVGSLVVLEDGASGKKVSYTLVSSAESDPSNGKLSVSSPVGKAVVGHSQGDEIQATAPRGLVRYRVISINTTKN